jgi:hypothetical protein
MGGSRPNEVIVPTAAWALNITSANSYTELWPIFAAGISVPEVFTCLFTGSHSMLAADVACTALMGYALTRCIISVADITCETMAAFLITLAMYKRHSPLTTGVW